MVELIFHSENYSCSTYVITAVESKFSMKYEIPFQELVPSLNIAFYLLVFPFQDDRLATQERQEQETFSRSEQLQVISCRWKHWCFLLQKSYFGVIKLVSEGICSLSKCQGTYLVCDQLLDQLMVMGASEFLLFYFYPCSEFVA